MYARPLEGPRVRSNLTTAFAFTTERGDTKYGILISIQSKHKCFVANVELTCLLQSKKHAGFARLLVDSSSLQRPCPPATIVLVACRVANERVRNSVSLPSALGSGAQTVS